MLERGRDARSDQAAGSRPARRGRWGVRPQVKQAEQGGAQGDRADEKATFLAGDRHLTQHVHAQQEQRERQRERAHAHQQSQQLGQPDSDRPGRLKPERERAHQAERENAERGAVPTVRGIELAGRCGVAANRASRRADPAGDRAPEQQGAADHHGAGRSGGCRRSSARRIAPAGGRAGSSSGRCHRTTLTLNWTVTRELAAVSERSAGAIRIQSPAAARSSPSWAISRSVASTRGGRTGPTGRPRRPSPALTRMTP